MAAACAALTSRYESTLCESLLTSGGWNPAPRGGAPPKASVSRLTTSTRNFEVTSEAGPVGECGA